MQGTKGRAQFKGWDHSDTLLIQPQQKCWEKGHSLVTLLGFTGGLGSLEELQIPFGGEIPLGGLSEAVGLQKLLRKTYPSKGSQGGKAVQVLGRVCCTQKRL